MVRGPLPALLGLAACAAFAARAAAQEPPAEAVNAAIDRGVDYLLRTQNRDGSWGVDINDRSGALHDLRDGSCGLAVYTLEKCGLTADHPAIQRALAFLLEDLPNHTYAAGVQLHVLGALNDPKYKKRMQELLDRLLELRQSNGWDYPGANRPDLSNSQVAALGLRAAQRAGLSLPKTVWGDLVECALRYQEQPVEVPGSSLLPKEKRRMAGFSYEPQGKASASMTTAGLTILGIATEDPARVDHRFDEKIAEAKELAVNWLDQHYSVEGNPEGDAIWHFYYLYGLERVGAFFKLDKIGDHPWYADGAKRLITEQRAEGGWWNDGSTVWSPAPVGNTCFALLFLRRATLSVPTKRETHFFTTEEADSDVWVRVDAKDSWTMWLSGFSPAVRSRLAPLSVERVEWWIDGQLAESVAGDASKPWTDQRFAVKRVPPRAGELAVECRVLAHAGASGGAQELRSKSLAVRSELVLEPWMLGYARDAAQNLLAGQDAVISASTEESGNHPKGDVLDGMQGTCWLAKADDPAPWIRLELAKGVRVKEIWLSPAAASETALASYARFTRVELRLNDVKAPITAAIEADSRLKTRVVLDKPTLLRKLEVRLLDPSREGGKCAGLAEIEGR